MGDYFFSSRKKIKKLINDPYRFFVDSNILRHAVAKKISIEVDRKTSIVESNRILASESEIEHIRSVVSEVAGLFFIHPCPGQREILVTSVNKINELVLALISLSNVGYEVAYDDKGKLVKNPSSSEIASFLLRKNVSLFRISSRETKGRSYFEFQVWGEFEDYYAAPKANMISRRLWKKTEEEYGLFKKGSVNFYHEIHGSKSELFCDFEVDYVFTWVNSDDPDWQLMYQKYNPIKRTDANSISRFLSRDELMFSLRAIDDYAPWVRKIHIVSNCKPPEWLDVTNERVNWVEHEEIFSEENLPTFSSHAIEASIQNINGLSNNFIYSNDDFILSRPVSKNDFFETNGNCKIKLEKWGNVNGKVSLGDPDYLNAARNCQDLLEKEFFVRPAQLHCHAPQAMRLDVLREMEGKYKEDFERTRSNKFRCVDDIAVTGFLFHHYVYLSGKGVKDYTPTLLIQRNHDYKVRFNRILLQKEKVVFGNEGRYLSFCVNDGADSHLDNDWNVSLNGFLDSYLPDKSSFEL